MNEYFRFRDGWFEYFVNIQTGKKKLVLDPNDVEIEPKLDGFIRKEVKDELR